jgi:hypothetical protein
MSVKKTKTQTSKKEERERESAKEIKMKRRFSGGNEERENRYWIEGEEKSSECAMRRERQLRTCGMDVAK